MSGFKYNQQDLDNIFQPISELSYLNNGFGVNTYDSTTNLKMNGNDIRNRYTRKNGCTVPTDSVVPSTGFKINGTDLNSLLFARTTYVRYEVVVEAEQGKTGASGGNVVTGTPSYGSKITIDCWLDSSKQYTVKKCYGGIGGLRSGGGGRQGGDGGNSLVLKDGTTDIVVAGAGGGNGSGNGKYGASAFYIEEDMPYSDYSYLGTDPRLTYFTQPKYTDNNTLLENMYDHDDDVDNDILPANIFYGLNAKEHHNYGGGGGWTSGGDSFMSATDGDKYDGGNGGVPNSWRRSSGGGGGGAGYYGGGGGAEVNTTDGTKGSPGGGSGTSYYNDGYPYNVQFKKLERTTNTDAKITITNKKTTNSTTKTFSGLYSGVNTISLP